MKKIKQHILRESFQEISHDTKFIRLATITTFIHSLFFVLYISYRTSVVLAKYQWWDNRLVHILLSYIHIGTSSIDITFLIIIGILLLIWFFILPPIGEGAMIFYLDNPKKQGSVSLGKWLSTFLQMFELDGALYAFNVLTFLIALFRVYVMGILWNGFIIVLMSIWFFIILSAAFLLPYTKLFITLEKKKFFDAMKASMNFSIEHFAITFKFIIVDFLLHLRFLVNIIIVFGIPLLLMYLGTKIGITWNTAIRTLFIIMIIWLFLLTAYINGIIEAFFATYRYKVYKHIKNIEQPEKEEDVIVAQQPLQQHVQQPQNVTINQYVTPPPHPWYQQYPQWWQNYQQQPLQAQYQIPNQALPNQQQGVYPQTHDSQQVSPTQYSWAPWYQHVQQGIPPQVPQYPNNTSWAPDSWYTPNPYGYPSQQPQGGIQQTPQQQQYSPNNIPQWTPPVQQGVPLQGYQTSPPPYGQQYQNMPPPQQPSNGYYDENGIWRENRNRKT